MMLIRKVHWISSASISGDKCIRQANDVEENPGPTIFDISYPKTTVSADSSFVMFVTELKTKILTAFENEIRVSFLLMLKYHVINTCTNFKQKNRIRELCRKEFYFQNLPSECNVCNMELPMYALFAWKPSIIIRYKDKVSKQYSPIHFPLKVHLTPNTIFAKMQTWSWSKSDLTFFRATVQPEIWYSLSRGRAGEGHGSILDLTSQTVLHACSQRVNAM